MWGISRQLAGDLPGSLTRLARAYDGNRRLGHGEFARDAAGKAALSCALRGDCIEASVWLDREAEFPESEGWLSELAPVAGRVARAMVALARLDREAAATALDSVRTVHFRDGHWPFVAAAFARFGLTFGSPSEALQQLRDQRVVHEGALGDGIAGPVLLCAELDLLLALGQGDRAVRLLEETEYSSPQFAVISARVGLLGGPAEDADVATAGELATSHTPWVRMELLLIRAAAAIPRELLTAMSGELPALAPIIALLDRSLVRKVFPDRLLLTELIPRELIVLRELARR